jgi:hypothetical protein
LLQISDALDLPELEKLTQSSNPPILDIGKHARLKGIAEDIHVSLHSLAGILLQCSYTPPDSNLAIAWSVSPPSPQCITAPALEVDCIWHLYQALASRKSIGLPLTHIEAIKAGQLVTVVYGCKAGAEGGVIVDHPGHINAVIDASGTEQRFNITKSRSLVQITIVLVPGQKHLPMKQQTLDWISTHGGHLFVTTSMLRSRAEGQILPAQIQQNGFTAPTEIIPHDDFNPMPLEDSGNMIPDDDDGQDPDSDEVRSIFIF